MRQSVIRQSVLTMLLCALLAPPAAADGRELRLGFISSFSGPVAVLGSAVDQGFEVALDQLGGRIGGIDTAIVKQDDEGKPDTGIAVARKMIVQDKVDVIYGVATTVVVVPVAALAARSKVVMIGPVSGPSMLAGKGCSPYFFSSSWDNNLPSEAMGEYLQTKGIANAYLFSANFQGGKDALAGFKNYFKRPILAETYTPFTAQDYSAEITQARAAHPAAIFAFYPGNLATNFVNQLAQSGLMGDVPFYSASTIDPTNLPAIGDAAIGTFQTAAYNPDLPYPANRDFVARFVARHHELPSSFAAQAYDGLMLLDAAIRSGADPHDRPALIHAMQTVHFASVRGPGFRINRNNFPVQNFYLLKVVKSDGTLIQQTQTTIFTDHADTHVDDCVMPAP